MRLRTTTAVAAIVGGMVVLVAVLGLSGGRSVAAGSARHAAIVESGVLHGRPWRVAVGSQGPHRKGICLQALTKTGEVLSCSAPAKRRGIVIAENDGRAPHGKARITVLAAALNQAVVTLRLVSDHGATITLHPRPIHNPHADAHIKNFRYLAKAFPGSLCLRRLETIGAEGRVLWQDPEDELEEEGLVCESGT